MSTWDAVLYLAGFLTLGVLLQQYMVALLTVLLTLLIPPLSEFFTLLARLFGVYVIALAFAQFLARFTFDAPIFLYLAIAVLSVVVLVNTLHLLTHDQHEALKNGDLQHYQTRERQAGMHLILTLLSPLLFLFLLNYDFILDGPVIWAIEGIYYRVASVPVLNVLFYLYCLYTLFAYFFNVFYYALLTGIGMFLRPGPARGTP